MAFRLNLFWFLISDSVAFLARLIEGNPHAKLGTLTPGCLSIVYLQVDQHDGAYCCWQLDPEPDQQHQGLLLTLGVQQLSNAIEPPAIQPTKKLP